MKGYKGMRADMTCRGKQYRVCGTYHEDNIALCERGLHFCEHLSDVFHYYSFGDHNRFFKVEAFGDIRVGDDKCVASDLIITRELTDVEIDRGYYGNGEGAGDLYGYISGKGCNYDILGDGSGDGYGCGSGDGGIFDIGAWCGYGDGDGFGNGSGGGEGEGYAYYGFCYNDNRDYNDPINIQRNLIFKEEL
jgi:hypothetical protein